MAALSGHLGGANALARRVAQVLGGTAVVTTASDALGTIAVDLLGQEFGWRIEDWANVTAASAAVVNGDPVAIYQDAGECGWWPDG
ncbi:MAG: cobalamin biosynthesis protein CbiG, partial [Chloroflexota bacterium]